MDTSEIRALTFDTGGTILDWHSAFCDALAAIGKAHNEARDWPALANQIRAGTLNRMLNLGDSEPAEYNFDGAHRATVVEVLAEHGLADTRGPSRYFLENDVMTTLTCWPDFPPALPQLRQQLICASFTILSFRIIIQTARRNSLSWDAVLSCEAFGKYKLLPAAYQTAARLLQLDPGQCMMVACHNFDLDAAKAQGFKTAFVRRPEEWGPAGPPDPNPNPQHDLIVDDFSQLVSAVAG